MHNLRLKPFHEFGTLRPWSHEIHVTLKDVPELRNLVQSGTPQKTSKRRNSRIILARPCGSCFGFRSNSHGAEFTAVKNLASEADPLLPEKDGPWRTHADT